MNLDKIVSDALLRLDGFDTKVVARNTLEVGSFDLKAYVVPGDKVEIHILHGGMMIGEIYGFESVKCSENLKYLDLFDMLKLIKIIERLISPVSIIQH